MHSPRRPAPPMARSDEHLPNRGPIAVGAATALAVVHALIVARRYHVGSFDDDASYVMAARAIATGHGLTSAMAGGYPLVGIYPPGYPALLAPMAAIWPSGDLAFRALSLGLCAAVLPLTWLYLGRRGLDQPLRLAVLFLLAMNPVLATYATMVMPEMAFVVTFLLLLLAVDRWEHQRATIGWAGFGVVLSAAALLWLKEAGIGLVIGVAAWLLFRRLYRKAVLAAFVPPALFAPVLVVRAVSGANLIGSRYAGDLGGAFKGGIGARVTHLVPAAVKAYAGQALPRSVVPTLGGFLPNYGPIGALLLVLTWTAAPLIVVGFVVWWQRHRDAVGIAVAAYLVETLVYPYTNERRLVLILPVIVAWYALGATSVFAALRRASRRLGGRVLPRLSAVAAMVASLILVGALVSQFTRDYLYFEGASSSSPSGSPYMALLSRLGAPHQVVETDYLWTTALYGGHRTANGAYSTGCDAGAITDALHADNAAYLLSSSLGGGAVDDACILPVVSALPGAIRLYRCARDRASVFELVGPGSTQPLLDDRLASAVVGGAQAVGAVDEPPQTGGDVAGAYWTTASTSGAGALTWTWDRPVRIAQLSLGAAASLDGTATSVTVALRRPDGTWRVAAESSGAVGADGRTPFLLVAYTPTEVATAARVTVAVAGSPAIAVHDFHVLGPAG